MGRYYIENMAFTEKNKAFYYDTLHVYCRTNEGKFVCYNSIDGYSEMSGEELDEFYTEIPHDVYVNLIQRYCIDVVKGEE